MKTLTVFLSFVLPVSVACAQPRVSTDYAITAETLDFGGGRISSADYSIQASIAPVTGVSEDSEPALTVARHGYIGQLYELLGYGLLASDFYPSEEGSTQLIPVGTADDGTNVVVPTSGFTFTALDGPVAGITPDGLVHTAAVYEDTPVKVGATSPRFEGQVQLLLYVLDTLPDNYGSYAADGLPDTWQIDHFGLENPLAAPLLDPDGDGQDNEFEYTAGLIPTDPLSRFLLRIEEVPGQPRHKDLKFGPVFAGRTYTVKSNTTLGGPWQDLAGPDDDQQQPERTVTDLQATEPRKFYRVEITKP